MTTQAEPNADLALLSERLIAAVSDLRPFAIDGATRKALKDAERRIRKLAATLDPCD